MKQHSVPAVSRAAVSRAAVNCFIRTGPRRPEHTAVGNRSFVFLMTDPREMNTQHFVSPEMLISATKPDLSVGLFLFCSEHRCNKVPLSYCLNTLKL